jgi:hypothetical protein
LSGPPASHVENSALLVGSDAGADAHGVLAARALECAMQVGMRLRDVSDARCAFDSAEAQLRHLALGPWRRDGLAEGHAGLALLFGALDEVQPGSRWDQVAHVHLKDAVSSLARRSDLGLFAGLTGAGIAAHELSRGGERYQGLLGAIDDVVAREVPLAAARLSRQDGVAVGAFDLISGLVGISAYLSVRDHAVADAARVIAAGGLAALCADSAPPRWRTPSEALGDPLMKDQYPDGNLNCGMAHGLPGILWVLASEVARSPCSPEVWGAVERTARWLAEHQVRDETGPGWPTAVSLTAGSAPVVMGRSTWCYGAPGVAHAVHRAGRAVGRPVLRQLALDGMYAAVRRPQALDSVPSPALCHGRAGLAACILRLAEEEHAPDLRELGMQLVNDLTASFDPALPLGWRSVHRGGALVDNPGFLDGAAGIALLLLSATAGTSWGWARALLIA